MRCVTRDAALGFHGRVLEDKWSGFVGVTTEANLILGRSRAQLASQETAVRIMAVAASEQTLVHAMMDRFGELRSDFPVAPVTQHRLRRCQQSSFYFGMMRRVAIYTSDIVLQVLGTQKVGMLFTKFMAAQTTSA